MLSVSVIAGTSRQQLVKVCRLWAFYPGVLTRDPKIPPTKIPPTKIPPSENSTQRKFHPAKIPPSEN